MTNTDIISKFTPELIDITHIEQLERAIRLSNLLIYGEIHGIQENAHVIYSLIRKLGIRQIAIENSPSVKKFIDAASTGVYDFSLIDQDTFDSSILSLEVAKTLATLLRESVLSNIIYIDTFFDNLDPSSLDHPDSPQKREEMLAETILEIDTTQPTLCLMGQWHTQPKLRRVDGIMHKSALYRLRQARHNIPFVHMIYRGGNAYNDGRILDLPKRSDVSGHYEVRSLTSLDFDIHVPHAQPIQLDKVT